MYTPKDRCFFEGHAEFGTFFEVDGTGWWDSKVEWELVAEVNMSVCSARDQSRVGTRLALKRLEWPYLLA